MLFLKATLTMLVPQNRTVKAANREYLNVLRILANCEIMDVDKTMLLLARPSRARHDIPTPQGEQLSRLERTHANLYNGLPLSLNAKPQ